MNLITHVILGLALSEAFMLSPLTVIIGSSIPDIDSLIGIEHRTITHSLLFLAITSLLIYKIKGKKYAYAWLIGLSSHYILDSITPMGIPLFYPLSINYSFNLAAWNDLTTNMAIIIASALVMLNKKNIHEFLTSQSKGTVFKTVNIILIAWLATLLFFPVNYCPGEPDPINVLKQMPGEVIALLNGTICTNVTLSTSASNNTYQVFTLCDNTGNITVWKGEWVQENNLSKGDAVTICGKYTTRYKQPEIYYVTQVTKN